MNRRRFLQTGTSLVAASSVSPLLNTANAQPAEAATVTALNPQGIRIAGIRMLPVMNGRYKVWTKKVGSGRTKVLLLHGGPGATHSYLEAMESFLPEAGVEFYYYDQLGCGNSDIPDDRSLWNLERYTKEVEEVRQGLGLDNFVLYGHSWGGLLAIEYALRHQKRLKGLVISNMTASAASYVEYVNELKMHLFTPAQLSQFNALENGKQYDGPAYEKLLMETLYPQTICRIQPWPEPLTRTFRLLNPQVYNEIQGKSEMEFTGNAKDWDRWRQLTDIRVPALTLGATYDEMRPEDIIKMATLMPNAQSHICPKGSHMSMWDDQSNYFSALLSFLAAL